MYHFRQFDIDTAIGGSSSVIEFAADVFEVEKIVFASDYSLVRIKVEYLLTYPRGLTVGVRKKNWWNSYTRTPQSCFTFDAD